MNTYYIHTQKVKKKYLIFCRELALVSIAKTKKYAKFCFKTKEI